MSDEVFCASIEQLESAQFAGRISYHLYNEPLLRKDLARLVSIVNRRLPAALQVLNTNGDLLDESRYTALREAGIDYFYVTRHSEGSYPTRPFQVVQSSTDLILTNRGGSLTSLPAPSRHARRTPCFAPSEMLIITVTGDVLLCYEDAHRKNVLGNVLTSAIDEIWNAEKIRAIRARLELGDRSGPAICRACSNVSHSRPGLSALEDPVLAAADLPRSEHAAATLKDRSVVARQEQAHHPVP